MRKVGLIKIANQQENELEETMDEGKKASEDTDFFEQPIFL